MADNDKSERQEVVIVDFQMRFGSMVLLLVKFALAAIPAAIILSIVFASLALLFAAFFGSM